MRKTKGSLTVFLFAFLALSVLLGCGGKSADSSRAIEASPTPEADDDDNDNDNDDATPDDDTQPGDYYPPDARGPYPVGVVTVQTVDKSRWDLWGLQYRGLPLEVWYPSTGEGGTPNDMKSIVGDLPAWAWPILQLVYGNGYANLIGIVTTAMRGAAPATADGPFPVLFFSHGISAIRFQNYTLCEHLASHGFVVVAPDHYDGAIFANLGGGDVVIFDPLTLVTGLVDRPVDVEFIYHYLATMPRPADLAADIPLDLARFAVLGHSYGGITAMQAGPAHPDFVKAIAPLNPLFIDAYPTDFTGPFFMLQSADDEIVGFGNQWTRGAFEKALSPKKVYALLKRGSHYSVTDACSLLPPWMIIPARGCGVADRIDPTLANHISAAYLTAFFKATLGADDRFAPFLQENHWPTEVEYAVQWPAD